MSSCQERGDGLYPSVLVFLDGCLYGRQTVIVNLAFMRVEVTFNEFTRRVEEERENKNRGLKLTVRDRVRLLLCKSGENEVSRRRQCSGPSGCKISGSFQSAGIGTPEFKSIH